LATARYSTTKTTATTTTTTTFQATPPEPPRVLEEQDEELSPEEEEERQFGGDITTTITTNGSTTKFSTTPASGETKNEKGEGEGSSDVPADAVPWYLEVEPPIHPTLQYEPPPLPDIPADSPKLMKPLVKLIAEELGVDDLSLLDLRELNPPAALGPDLVMIFGTARSERHLHVSADRLVRWLRARGISATADGLLGRNELKTRLRRHARKAKLLGNSPVARGGDDGISTGWICVNLGTVGSSKEEVEFVDETGAPTGFGLMPHSGTTIVVQLMTASRREELDLEKLWNGILNRGLQKGGSKPKDPATEKDGFAATIKPFKGKKSVWDRPVPAGSSF